MYPSLFTYFMNDFEDILSWCICRKKYGKDI